MRTHQGEQAVAHAAWAAVPGCVAGRDRVGKRANQGTVGRPVWHESYQVGQKCARVEGIGRGRLQRAPEAFIGMLEGRNFGKLIVRVDDSNADTRGTETD